MTITLVQLAITQQAQVLHRPHTGTTFSDTASSRRVGTVVKQIKCEDGVGRQKYPLLTAVWVAPKRCCFFNFFTAD